MTGDLRQVTSDNWEVCEFDSNAYNQALGLESHMTKKRVSSKSRRKGEGVKASTVLARIRSNALGITGDNLPVELLKDLMWIVDRGLEKKVWKLLEEDLPEKSYEAIVFATKLAASRFTLMASVSEAAREIEEGQAMVVIPFAILLSVAFLAGEEYQFPTALPDSIGHAVESGLMHQALGMPEDVTVFFDPRLYKPQHPEWLQPSATRRYLKSIAEHIANPTLRVDPLSSDYKRRVQTGLMPDEVEMSQRLICGAILTSMGGEGHSLAEAGNLLFGDRTDESNVMEEEFKELNRLIEDELAERCRLTESTVLANPTPIELWDVPGFVFQEQRTVSLGVAIEMALEGVRENEPDREIKSALYVSTHGSEESLSEFRFAAYLIDEEGLEEALFFNYAWEIVFEVEDPEDINEAIADIAGQLNASVNMVDGLRPDERCDQCGAKLFCGPNDESYHELVDQDDCPTPLEN